MTLVARTRELAEEVDLLDVAGPTGYIVADPATGLAGRGEARRVPATEIEAALAAIEVDDAVGLPGCGPLAFGALPFDDAPSGSMVVPAIVVGCADDGTRWVTTIGEADAEPLPLLSPPRHVRPASAYTVTTCRPPEAWTDAVAAAVSRINGGELTKAVLARELVVEADEAIDVVAVLERLRTAYPTTMLYAVDGLVGATPELLVSRFGDVVRSHPFAGTIPRTGDPDADARAAAGLLESTKDRAEHQITIDMVLDTVLPFCSYVDSEPEPSIVRLANVQHLASFVEGRLSEPPASVLALVRALHPTPAVCGWPTEAARRVIADLEGFDRGRYTGAVGWMDANGDGQFGVAIRCAEIDGNRARLFAGNGIVADSDPARELAETRAKLQAMLAAIVRP